MKTQQVQAGGGDQDGEFLDELLGVEQEVGGAIPSGMGKLVQQLAVGSGLGRRQVEGAEVAQYVHDVAGKCKSLIYTKGA